MSGLFKQVMCQLGINTAYHPQPQGALERFHQTFKAIMRAYWDKDWDEGLHLLLFAVWESVHKH